jgi:hypothetical protein
LDMNSSTLQASESGRSRAGAVRYLLMQVHMISKHRLNEVWAGLLFSSNRMLGKEL